MWVISALSHFEKIQGCLRDQLALCVTPPFPESRKFSCSGTDRRENTASNNWTRRFICGPCIKGKYAINSSKKLLPFQISSDIFLSR
jgi:hypothetical protein